MRALVISMVLLAACDGVDEPGVADSTSTTDQDATVVQDTGPIDTALPDIGDPNEDKNLRNGVMARVGHIVDGDTFDVYVGTLAPKKWPIRMRGLAAPECFKDFVHDDFGGGYACTTDDELFGLKSYQALRTMLEGKIVKITCDDVAAGQVCPLDVFDRYLAYAEVDGKDAATEMARGGNGFSYTDYAASKRGPICTAEYEAQANKVGMWALGDLTYILSKMHAATRKWYNQTHESRCEAAIH